MFIIYQKIKSLIKKSIFYQFINPFLDKYKIIIWFKNGKPIPPPTAVTQKVVKEYAKKFCINIMIETGTCTGNMVYSTRNIFAKIFSIELNENLYKKAKKRLKDFKNIRLFQGDSAELLPKMLNHVNTPCLFWLDAHYSGGATSKGDLETPIIKELVHIFSHHILDHVILIDDARCFTGNNDYPKIESLVKFVQSKNKGLVFVVKDDIIRIYPKA